MRIRLSSLFKRLVNVTETLKLRDQDTKPFNAIHQIPYGMVAHGRNATVNKVTYENKKSVS